MDYVFLHKSHVYVLYRLVAINVFILINIWLCISVIKGMRLCSVCFTYLVLCFMNVTIHCFIYLHVSSHFLPPSFFWH